METEHYGKLPDGGEVTRYTLRNSCGSMVRVLSLGCILESIQLGNRDGKIEDITLGYDRLEDWLENRNYFGAVVGRIAGRIGGAKFPLEGREVQLAVNRKTENESCHIHGGEVGLSRRLWEGRPVKTGEGEGVRLSYHSPDGEEGYPGNVDFEVLYILTESNALRIEMKATTDCATPVNPANHAYWNLSGDPARPVLDHEVTLPGPEILEIGESMIPTGRRLNVRETPFDFSKPTAIGARIDRDHVQLQRAGGYDHYWILPEQEDESMIRMAARVREPVSGRVMELLTNQPGVVFYTGNFLGEGGPFKGGAKYPRRGGLCLETQGYPDAPNHPEFPGCILRPGEKYNHIMVYQFSTD